MSTTEAFINENAPRFQEELFEFLRIPSISTLPEHADDVRRAAEFVASKLRDAGLENVEVIPTDKHPLVYADWLHAPGAPTVLCYGHFDVQPVDPIDEWKSPPFEPTVRNGSVYARGAADDKGQLYIHIKAIEALHAVHGKLPVNVKVLIEGEEEVGGESISAYLPANRAKLKADVALVSDTSMYAAGLPSLDIGLRGMIYQEWIATGPAQDLHSGMYGGAAPNAVFGLVELLAKCKNAAGVCQIPGFYDDVEPPAAAEKESWDRLPFDETEYLRTEVGSTRLTGEPGYSVMERTWARPTFEVHGIGGGFTGPGAKTVIPAKAVAKVSMRLVPRQDPAAILPLIRKFVAANTPAGISVTIRELNASPASMVSPENVFIQKAALALTDTFGVETVFTRCGGSIPVVGEFDEFLGMPTILMGFGLPDDGLHGPNEKFLLDNFQKGIRTVAHFFESLAPA
ncbi:MAG: dipeptidase [Acidobacteria bacterium]|nr:dipeptidase [Acidobacteriota bacterium]